MISAPMPEHVRFAFDVRRVLAFQLQVALVFIMTSGRCPRAWAGLLAVAALTACAAVPDQRVRQAGGLQAGMSRAEVEGTLGEPDGMQQAPGRIGYQYLARPGTAGAGAAGTRYAIFADGRLVDWGAGAVRAEAGPNGRTLAVTPAGGAPPAPPRAEPAPAPTEPAAALPPRAASTALATPAPALTTLPAEALSRVDVRFPAGNPSAESRAGEIVRVLRGKGLTVSGPASVAPAGWATGVDYYFVEDRESANRVARAAGGALGPGRLVAAPRGAARPRPGTVVVVVSGPS